MLNYSTKKAHFQYYNTGLSVPAVVIENSWQCSTESNETGDQWDRRNSVRYVACPRTLCSMFIRTLFYKF